MHHISWNYQRSSKPEVSTTFFMPPCSGAITQMMIGDSQGANYPSCLALAKTPLSGKSRTFYLTLAVGMRLYLKYNGQQGM